MTENFAAQVKTGVNKLAFPLTLVGEKLLKYEWLEKNYSHTKTNSLEPVKYRFNIVIMVNFT